MVRTDRVRIVIKADLTITENVYVGRLWNCKGCDFKLRAKIFAKKTALWRQIRLFAGVKFIVFLWRCYATSCYGDHGTQNTSDRSTYCIILRNKAYL